MRETLCTAVPPEQCRRWPWLADNWPLVVWTAKRVWTVNPYLRRWLSVQDAIQEAAYAAIVAVGDGRFDAGRTIAQQRQYVCNAMRRWLAKVAANAALIRVPATSLRSARQGRSKPDTCRRLLADAHRAQRIRLSIRLTMGRDP